MNNDWIIKDDELMHYGIKGMKWRKRKVHGNITVTGHNVSTGSLPSGREKPSNAAEVKGEYVRAYISPITGRITASKPQAGAGINVGDRKSRKSSSSTLKWGVRNRSGLSTDKRYGNGLTEKKRTRGKKR